jgi:hypothetical protein
MSFLKDLQDRPKYASDKDRTTCKNAVCVIARQPLRDLKAQPRRCRSFDRQHSLIRHDATNAGAKVPAFNN